MGQINTMKTNSKRKKDLRLANWNVRSLYRTGGLRITINELRKYKIAIAAIQETKVDIYTSSLANNHEFGTAFLVGSKFNHMVINFTPKADFSTTLSSTYIHQQMTQKMRPRINFVSSWSRHTQMGDANAKVGRETVNQKTIGKHSLHKTTNENGLRLVDLAAGRQMAITSEPGIPQMDTPSTRAITASSTEDTFLTS
jgi:hypothetical protein